MLACEAAVLLQDWDLVTRCVWRAYHLLLPLLGIAAMGRLLLQARTRLFVLAMEPGHTDDPVDRVTKTLELFRSDAPKLVFGG